jgi:hypothetical protein
MTSCPGWYPEGDLNPHSRNGHRILSPACLPFHHPGILFNWMIMIMYIHLLRTHLSEEDGGMATPAVGLLTKNTHRVFSLRSPLPSGQNI